MNHTKRETPSIIKDDTEIYIESLNNDVVALGTIFISPNLTLKGNDVILEAVILNHSTTDRNRIIDFNLFGKSFYDAMRNGKSFFDALAVEDPLLMKVANLIHSNSAGQRIANSWNLSIEFLNNLNSLLSGIRHGNLDKEILQRYGLGDANGFNPTLTITYTLQVAKQRSQSVGSGGVYCKNFTVVAKDKFVLGNAIPVVVETNMTVTAKDFIQSGAKLHNSIKNRSDSATFGVKASGDFVKIGAAHSQYNSKDTQYVPQQLHVGGELTVNGDNWTQIGAQTNAGNLAGAAKQVTVITPQDKHKGSGWHASGDSAGNISGGFTNEKSAKINQPSGLHVKNGIDDKFKAGNTKLVASSITTDGVNGYKTNTLHSESVTDRDQSISFSVNTNVKNFTDPKKPVKGANSKDVIPTSNTMIPVVNVQLSRKNYKAVNRSTLFGQKGTPFVCANKRGDLNTSSANGKKVLKDNNVSLKLIYPFLILEGLQLVSII